MRRIISLILAVPLLTSVALPMSVSATATTGNVVLSVSAANGKAGDIVEVFVNVNANSGIVGLTISLVFDAAKLEYQAPTGNSAATRKAFTEGTMCEGVVSMFSANYIAADSKLKVSLGLDEELFGAGKLLRIRFLVKQGWSGETPLTLVQAPTDTVIVNDDLENIPFTTAAGKITVSGTANNTTRPTEATTKPETTTLANATTGDATVTTVSNPTDSRTSEPFATEPSTGVPVTNSQGKPVYVTDAQGNPVPVTDAQGEPVTDEEGNTVYETEPAAEDETSGGVFGRGGRIALIGASALIVAGGLVYWIIRKKRG